MSSAPAFRAERLVQRAAHPSFTEDVARSLVAGLSVPRLLAVWRLADPTVGRADDRVSPRARANRVVLRGVVLDALEATDPDFVTWLVAKQPSSERGSR